MQALTDRFGPQPTVGQPCAPWSTSTDFYWEPLLPPNAQLQVYATIPMHPFRAELFRHVGMYLQGYPREGAISIEIFWRYHHNLPDRARPVILIYGNDARFRHAANISIKRYYPEFDVEDAECRPGSNVAVDLAGGQPNRSSHGRTKKDIIRLSKGLKVYCYGSGHPQTSAVQIRIVHKDNTVTEAVANLVRLANGTCFYHTVAHVLDASSIRPSCWDDWQYLGSLDGGSCRNDYLVIRPYDQAITNADRSTIENDDLLETEDLQPPSGIEPIPVYMLRSERNGGPIRGTMLRGQIYAISQFCKTWHVMYTVQLMERVRAGDSGSIVVNAQTYEVCGYLRFGCKSSGVVHIVPAHHHHDIICDSFPRTDGPVKALVDVSSITTSTYPTRASTSALTFVGTQDQNYSYGRSLSHDDAHSSYGTRYSIPGIERNRIGEHHVRRDEPVYSDDNENDDDDNDDNAENENDEPRYDYESTTRYHDVKYNSSSYPYRQQSQLSRLSYTPRYSAGLYDEPDNYDGGLSEEPEHGRYGYNQQTYYANP